MVNNTKYGSGALANNTGDNNTAIGAYTSYNNLDASNNTAIGSNSSFFNTIGSNNTALGAGSLCNNVNGSLNTAIGSSALEGNTGATGCNENVAIGAQSLYNNRVGQNTAVGTYSLFSNTTGTSNDAFGFNALHSNTSGIDNVAIGFKSLSTNNTGDWNTAVGTLALTKSTSSSNTAVGTACLTTNSSGSQNDGFGAGALKVNTTGSSNAAFGFRSLYSNKNTSYNTALGNQSLYNNIGTGNTSVGYNSAYNLKNGSYNTFIGNQSDIDISSNTYNYSTAIGYNSKIDASNQIMLGGIVGGSYPNVVIPGLANYTTYQPGNYTNNTLVSKEYVDTFVSGLSIQQPVVAIENNVNIGEINENTNSIINIDLPLLIDAVTIQDGSAVLLNAQTDATYNGVYILTTDITVGTGKLTRRTLMDTGDSALSAYIFVREGSTYARTSWVQSNNQAMVGTDKLNFNLFNTFDYELGRGLDIDNTGGKTTINVDTSLNFINYLDSTQGVDGASGILNIGTYSNQTIIGPTGGQVVFNSAIVGPTGTFTRININGISNNSGNDPLLEITNTLNSTELKITPGLKGNTSAPNYTTYEMPNSGTHFFWDSVEVYETLNVDGSANFATDLSVNAITIGRGNGNSYDNTVVGNQAFKKNTSGTQSIAIGHISLANNTSGSCNVAVGMQSLYHNSTGSNCISLGYESLFYSNNNNNTSVGHQSLYNPSGTYDTALGYQSGYGTKGSYNTLIGSHADVDISTNVYNYSTALGYNAKIDASNQIMLGGKNGSGAYPIVVVPGGITGPTGSFTYLSSLNNTYLATSSGSVGIRKNANLIATLDVDGSGNFSGQVTASNFSANSDYRIKENVMPLNDAFVVDNLIPVTYKNIKTCKQDIGLIAHELQEYYPYLVDGVKDGENLQSVNYTGLIGILIKEVKDLKNRVSILENNSN